jgi:hypothetical protein
MRECDRLELQSLSKSLQDIIIHPGQTPYPPQRLLRSARVSDPAAGPTEGLPRLPASLPLPPITKTPD